MNTVEDLLLLFLNEFFLLADGNVGFLFLEITAVNKTGKRYHQKQARNYGPQYNSLFSFIRLCQGILFFLLGFLLGFFFIEFVLHFFFNCLLFILAIFYGIFYNGKLSVIVERE